jgi:hypothetical protein
MHSRTTVGVIRDPSRVNDLGTACEPHSPREPRRTSPRRSLHRREFRPEPVAPALFSTNPSRPGRVGLFFELGSVWPRLETSRGGLCGRRRERAEIRYTAGMLGSTGQLVRSHLRRCGRGRVFAPRWASNGACEHSPSREAPTAQRRGSVARANAMWCHSPLHTL